MGSSMKRVLITGAAGFIGSHLVEKFLREGYSVMGYDNFSTGKESNISHLFNNDSFEFCNYDVCKFMSSYDDLDYIIHLACPASPKDYQKLPIETMKVCSYGTHNCLGLAKYKNARFVLASTSEVYGDPLEHPQKESYWGNVNSTGNAVISNFFCSSFANAISLNLHMNAGTVQSIALHDWSVGLPGENIFLYLSTGCLPMPYILISSIRKLPVFIVPYGI